MTLWSLQAECVDLLRADVPRKQKSVAGTKASPGTRAKGLGIDPQFLQVYELVHFRVPDSKSKISALTTKERIEINVCAIGGPGKIAERVQLEVQLLPLLVLHIIEH